jgi:hypothetical protein
MPKTRVRAEQLTGLVTGTGSTWRTGEGAPDNAVGIEGDFYLDVASGDLYKRGATSYSLAADLIQPSGSIDTNLTQYGFSTITPSAGVLTISLATNGVQQAELTADTQLTVTALPGEDKSRHVLVYLYTDSTAVNITFHTGFTSLRANAFTIPANGTALVSFTVKGNQPSDVLVNYIVKGESAIGGSYNLAEATTLDWEYIGHAGSFKKAISTDTTFTFSNVQEGQQINLLLDLGNGTMSETTTVPAMSADSYQGYESSASSVLVTGYEARMAFNQSFSPASSWVSGVNAMPAWLKIKFPTTRYIGSVKVYGRTEAAYDQAPKNYTIETSLDGDEWTTVATVTNQNTYTSPGVHTFTPVRCNQVRLTVTANWGNQVVGIMAIELFESTLPVATFPNTVNWGATTPATTPGYNWFTFNDVMGTVHGRLL